MCPGAPRRLTHLQGLWHERLQPHILQLQIQPRLPRQNHHLHRTTDRASQERTGLGFRSKVGLLSL